MPVMGASRRSFSNEEKLEFVRLYQAAAGIRGERVKLLRQYNLAGTTVRPWLKAAEEGRLGPGAKPPGEKAVDTRDRARLARLEQENTRLRRQLEQAEAVMAIMGKAHELLQDTMNAPDPQEAIPPALMSLQEYQQWLQRYRIS